MVLSSLPPRDTARKIGVVVLGILLVLAGSYHLLGASPADASNNTTLPDTENNDPKMPTDDGDEYSGPATTPPVEDIPEGGTGENFELVGHTPLLDEHQYVGNGSLRIPRGSNGEITAAGDCVYVGSFTGNQPPLIVDVADPTEPRVVGPVPNAVPGVANGIDGSRPAEMYWLSTTAVLTVKHSRRYRTACRHAA